MHRLLALLLMRPAYKKLAYRCTSLTAPPKHPKVGLCLGPYGGPEGRALSFGRSTPVPGQPPFSGAQVTGLSFLKVVLYGVAAGVYDIP